MPFRSYNLLFILPLFFTAPFGCGYHFHAEGDPVGIEIKSLAIPMMTSTSSTLGFESDFTSVIREEFISHSNVSLVSRDEAGMVLIGNISKIITIPLTYDLSSTIVQDETTYYALTDSRRLKVRLDIKLVERATGKVMWEEQGMEEKARFYVTTDPMANRYYQKKALREVAKKLADRIYLKTMERF